ncbi:MAG: MqnA/MqnD/SBP family protein [Phycisphaerales bacterium]
MICGGRPSGRRGWWCVRSAGVRGGWRMLMGEDVVRLTLAHSPDSDDLVMWWPLVGQDGSGAAVDTGRYRFELVARDVEELNRLVVGEGGRAWRDQAPHPGPLPGGERGGGRLETGPTGEGVRRHGDQLCGVSGDRGSVRDHGVRGVVRGGVRAAGGGARGFARSHLRRLRPRRRVGVPGVNTSAFMALSLMVGECGFEHVEMLFSDIPGAVARGEVDAGVLIHEAQLTFGEMGLRVLVDLGAWWTGETGLPLPLGLNVVRRDLDERYGRGTVREVARILDLSVRHAVGHPAQSRAYLRANRGDRAEWDDDALLDEYLRMYVSELTVDMGARGREAIEAFLGRGAAAGLVASVGRIEVV